MSNPGPGSGDIFDVKKVRRLVEMMKEHDLAEIDLRQGDQRVRLRRGAEPMISMPRRGSSCRAASRQAMLRLRPRSLPWQPAGGDLAVIKSPMVGTFYGAPNPESPPFVKVGDHVGPETIVCIIEAMKVFNEIPAEISGKSDRGVGRKRRPGGIRPAAVQSRHAEIANHDLNCRRPTESEASGDWRNADSDFRFAITPNPELRSRRCSNAFWWPIAVKSLCG